MHKLARQASSGRCLRTTRRLILNKEAEDRLLFWWINRQRGANNDQPCILAENFSMTPGMALMTAIVLVLIAVVPFSAGRFHDRSDAAIVNKQSPSELEPSENAEVQDFSGADQDWPVNRPVDKSQAKLKRMEQ